MKFSDVGMTTIGGAGVGVEAGVAVGAAVGNGVTVGTAVGAAVNVGAAVTGGFVAPPEADGVGDGVAGVAVCPDGIGVGVAGIAVDGVPVGDVVVTPTGTGVGVVGPLPPKKFCPEAGEIVSLPQPARSVAAIKMLPATP